MANLWRVLTVLFMVAAFTVSSSWQERAEAAKPKGDACDQMAAQSLPPFPSPPLASKPFGPHPRSDDYLASLVQEVGDLEQQVAIMESQLQSIAVDTCYNGEALDALVRARR